MTGRSRAGLVPALALLCACGGPAVAGRSQAPGVSVEVRPLRLSGERVRAMAGPGDTLESLCRRLAGDEWHDWSSALAGNVDPRSLRPGMALEGRWSPAGRLERMALFLDRRTTVHVAREEDGSLRTWREEIPLERDLVRLEGTIESSLFEAVERAGGDAELAVRLARIFQWDVDFFRDLRKGDRFVVVADRLAVEGRPFGWGTLFAARFVNAGRVLDAVAYPDGEGRLAYYDLEGRPLRKQFLKAPLEFSRVTSGFSLRRFHPVLKRRMPHYGVDYGAPVGTPVHVTADGVVRFVGRKGGAGKMVSVRHANGYETNYLHLSRYARGIRKGVRVRQGQVIGYVGQTGWATGPHLDYRVRLNGKWINPMRIASPPARPIGKDRLRRYLSHAIAVQDLLDGREPPAGAAC